MPLVYLGNSSVQEVHHKHSAPEGAVPFGHPDAELFVVTRVDRDGNACEVRLPDGLTPQEALADIMGVWRYQSSMPPAWVACEDEALAIVLTAQFGCPERAFFDAQNDYQSQVGAL